MNDGKLYESGKRTLFYYILFLNRWKGENVSAAEVSNVINSAEFIQDSNVFGVPVPGMFI